MLLMKQFFSCNFQNQDQSQEAQEIYFFLQKLPPGKIKNSAKRLLNGMDSDGSMAPMNKMVENMSMEILESKLERRLNMGMRLENLLNMMGKKFQFKTMFLDLATDVLDITSEYIEIFEEEQDHWERELAASFQILDKKEQKLNKTDLEMGYKMEELIIWINYQIEQMVRKQEQEAKKSALCSIGSLFIPGVPFTKAIGQGKRFDFLTHTLARFNLCYAGGWSLWRPYSIFRLFSDILEED